MLRTPILVASRSAQVRTAVTHAPVTRSVVRRFVAGEATTDALAAVARLQADGLRVTLDHLGEDTLDAAAAGRTVQGYLTLLTALDDAGLARGAEVSVKLSAVGQAVPPSGTSPHGPALALDGVRRIAEAAYGCGARVNLDVEDHTTIDGMLAVLRDLRADFPDVGVAMQAMLRRTPGDLADLTGPGSRVRLVKGAYAEPDSVSVGDAAAVDLAYVRCMRLLLAGQGYPMLGTHDPRMIEIAGSLVEEFGRTPDSFEHQMLYGIRPDEQLRLRAEGRQVRVYVPYGTDWYGYLTRRLAERPANLLFFLRSLISRN
ncbi:proline dehydrogenase family protein [Nakamurella flavida]|uniref:proline dehydrogenase n=1 Tax=Nakamurella flavida TaxID=363630 RepID=A0A938YHG8_9ACTN|nr:proline dehydrogenase family protein [Nakamurella flavida]MBM9477770.1 proline dehydrogenase family protein [Nakamurella flavida]